MTRGRTALQERRKRTLTEIGRVDQAARLRGEGEAVILSQAGELHHFFELGAISRWGSLLARRRVPERFDRSG